MDGESSHWIVESAGTWTIPGQSVPSDASLAAQVMGIDLKDHLTRQIDRDLLAKYDLILAMEKGHREALRIEFPFIQNKIYLVSMLADQLEYDIADPANSSLGIGEIITEMSRLIDRAYPNICQLVQSCKTT